MSFLNNLNWRYATKKFDSLRAVSDSDRQKIFEAIRMAPTSFGLQPFHITVVTDKNLRENLRKNAYNQSQLTDSALVLVFSARTDLVKRADDYSGLIPGGASPMIKNSVSGMGEEEAKNWAAKQAYIALGFAMAACAELQIDSCPMEGFNADAYKKVLNLPDHFYPQALLAVGYRSADDKPRPKIRFPVSELFS